jgi:hypothetical protein
MRLVLPLVLARPLQCCDHRTHVLDLMGDENEAVSVTMNTHLSACARMACPSPLYQCPCGLRPAAPPGSSVVDEDEQTSTLYDGDRPVHAPRRTRCIP